MIMCSMHVGGGTQAYVCLCVWKPRVDTEYTPYFYFYFFFKPGSVLTLTKITGLALLTDQQTPGITSLSLFSLHSLNPRIAGRQHHARFRKYFYSIYFTNEGIGQEHSNFVSYFSFALSLLKMNSRFIAKL